VLFFCTSIAACSIAQNPANNFSAYQQKIPGSALSFKMMPINSGNFLIGSPSTEKNHSGDESPQKNIQLSAFWMGAYEVTRDEFDVFLKDENTSQNVDVDAITRPSPQYIDLSYGMGKEGGYPANSMSQYGALMYCRWLYQKTGIFYRLPTEAEWEYACRAGTSTAYFFGSDSTQLDKYAWYENNSGEKFHKAGEKLPNPWGLYDMLGNVMEWTMDHYESNRYNTIAGTDPVVPPNPVRYPKVLRGGGFNGTAAQLRSAKRVASDPVWNRRDPQIPKSKWWITDAPSVGFRLVRPLQQPNAAEADLFFKNYLDQ
ncbi:MAG: formylglycine-rating enzyme family protein, partial [Sediminibacterium sp.]|nr:formylglycine-rating enzyme family protein [Sediminibacterium sp.]